MIADGRIEYTSECSAKVFSSDKSEFYKLAWSEDFSKFYSDDNASKWQATLGYPIVAILLDKGALTASPVASAKLGGVNWNAINNEFKRDYRAAANSVLDSRMSVKEVDLAYQWAESCMLEIGSMSVQKVKMAELT